MKILNVIETQTGLQIMLICIGILGIVISGFWVLCVFMEHCEWLMKFLSISCLIFSCIFIAWGLYSSETHPLIRYEVIIDDIDAVIDKCDIISQRGEIFIVEPKDQPRL